MPDPDYSNREIDRMFSEITQSLDRIEKQTTKTNGRVTRLEKVVLVASTAAIVYLTLTKSSFLGLISPFL